MSARFLALILCCALSACGGAPRLGPVAGPDGQPSSGVRVMEGTSLPAPSAIDATSINRPYLVGAFDILVIDVFGIEALSQREVRVDGSGRVSFPIAGTVDAAGRTTTELASEIEARLRTAHIRDPQVTVNLKEPVSQLVTVDGEVRTPGLYPVLGQMTLMRAVARAEGLGEFARQDDVVVFRTVGGQRYAALYNLRAIRRGTYDDPEIYANDIVIVGNDHARRLFRDLLQVVPVLSTPLIIALERN